MGYEVRSHDEVIFEAETPDEFQDILVEIAKQEHNGNFDYSDLNGTAYLQTHEPNWNRLEPTAEWSRIQQALKERDELAAELERVKAERDELKSNSFSDDLKTMSILAETDQHIKDCKTFLEEFKKLSALKSRLPVNADGDVVLWGDEVWMWDAESKKPVRGFVETIIEADEEHEFMGDMPDEKIPFTTPDWCCHSTAESCRAANESK